MPTESEFRALVAQAYEHLYDLVYLRCHPLADLLIGEMALARAKSGLGSCTICCYRRWMI